MAALFEPEAPPVTDAQHEADKAGAAGYSCLVAVAAGGFVGAAGLGLLALRAFFLARVAPVEQPGGPLSFLQGLEAAVALTGTAAVLAVVGTVAAVVLLKEMGDEEAARRRGPIR